MLKETHISKIEKAAALREASKAPNNNLEAAEP
jgi:hypothetical protein